MQQQTTTRRAGEIEPMTYAVGQRLAAEFPRLNKQGTLAEYRKQTERTVCTCQVERVLSLTAVEYDDLAKNLLREDDRFGEGGHESDAVLPEGWNYLKGSNEERDAFAAKAYRLVTVVQAPKRATFVVDAQGHKCARYVGLSPKLATPIIRAARLSLP